MMALITSDLMSMAGPAGSESGAVAPLQDPLDSPPVLPHPLPTPLHHY